MVEAVGEGVSVPVGTRVACLKGSTGLYAEYAVVPAWRAVAIPPSISDVAAASLLLQGLTAHYLVRDSYRVKQGDTILVHAAAGGTGLLLCQLGKHLG